MAQKKILVIEDNLLNLELVGDLLEISNYKVLQATTAEEGIELAKNNNPDLILMDLSLPGMDGLEATKILKQEQQTQDIPVVVLTANVLQKNKDKAFELGCQGYITKPIDTRAFIKQIAEYVR